MKVYLFQPAKNAMQSGRAKDEWHLQFEATGRFVEPMMGWSGSTDTKEQLRMTFETKDEALAYATKKGFEILEREPQIRTVKPKAYAANFAMNRKKYADPATS